MTGVFARDLHAGDAFLEHDWTLHVQRVEVDQRGVAVVVAEFDFPLHLPLDRQLQLLLGPPAPGMVPPGSSVLAGGGAAATSVAAAPLVLGGA